MKKIIYFAFALLFIGCDDFLYRPPMDAFSPTTYWKTEDDLKGGINSLYTYMNHSWNEDLQSIDAYSGSANAVSSGTHETAKSDNVWTNSYVGIYRVNEFLDNYQNASVTDDIKNRYKGEALYFRALLHFNLVKRFGDVTIVDHKLDLESPELYSDRNERTKVIDFVLDELKQASELLPTQSWIEKNKPNEVGRITSGTALALMARIALYEGTRCKFHNYKTEKVSEYLTIAKNTSWELINSDEYELEQDIENLFGPKGENSDEIILSYRYTEEQGAANPRHKVITEANGYIPTKDLVDAFLCDDGLPIDKSPKFQKWETIDSEFENRAPRMYYTIWRPLTEHPNLPNTPVVPDLTANRTGYIFNKGMDASLISSGKNSYTDEILFRLTEQYLIYAEACFELNDAITDDELNASINELRKRGGMNVMLTNSFVSQNSLNMRDEIRRERRIELCTEGFRYDDIIRWKTAETELVKPIIGAKYFSEYYPEGTVSSESITSDGFIIAQTADSRSFDPEKHYLFPLPLDELRKNPNMTQNPGWD